jgi:hypothetical protein
MQTDQRKYEKNPDRLICHILLGWWDDEPARTKKITPFKRDWSWNERIVMQ